MKCKIGIMPGYIHKKGHVGVVSRSGTLAPKGINRLKKVLVKRQLLVLVSPVNGTNFIDVLKAFNGRTTNESSCYDW